MKITLEQLKERFCKKTVSVIGIGVSNTPLIDFLLDMGAFVVARDKKDEQALGDLATALRAKNVKLVLGERYLDDIHEDFILKTPGIRFDTPQIAEAVKRGAVLSSEMELFFEVCPCKIVAVTGSDGKTTTTTLISEILKEEFRRTGSKSKVFLGGNIGKPLLADTPQMSSQDVAVLELSSFQLQTMRQSPDIAVVTNITPNHLNFHVDMQEYIDAKTNIFAYQKSSDRIVLNADNSVTAGFIGHTPGKSCCFSTALTLESLPKTELCAYLDKDVLTVSDENGSHAIMSRDEIRLPGIHNVQNYMAAILALWGEVSVDSVRTVAREFGGVEHRLELVREKDGVRYFNSSIDTSPTRTAAALRSFSERPIVICGGYDKHIPFEPLAEVLIERARAVVLTGATAQKIGDAIMNNPNFDFKKLPLYFEKEFHEAVKTASKIAHKGDVVILSPACASFDAFENFAARGRFFKSLVMEL